MTDIFIRNTILFFEILGVNIEPNILLKELISSSGDKPAESKNRTNARFELWNVRSFS